MHYPDFLPVTAAIIYKEGKILIARKRHAFMGYTWEFPGGKLEEDETLEECLQREIREELGIEIVVGPLVSARKHVINCQISIVLYAYRADYISGDIVLTDHDLVEWVDPEDLVKYSFPDPDRQVVGALLNEA